MTKKEVKKILDNSKVYVNGKNEEIQKKLFSLGYLWRNDKDNIDYIDAPFFYINSDNTLSFGRNMKYFTNHPHKEITAEDILSISTETKYRPFKSVEECFNEMKYHEPFGWIKNKNTNKLYNILTIYKDEDTINISVEDFILKPFIAFESFIFADGAPYGIKEEE